MMPSDYTASISVEDSREMVKRLGVLYSEIAIRPIYDAFVGQLAGEFAGLAADTTEENLQARARGTLLMALSNKHGSIVLTTGNKSEMAVKFGEAQVKLWRRSYDVRPPALELDDPRHPRFDRRYALLPAASLPACECLADTVARMLPRKTRIIMPVKTRPMAPSWIRFSIAVRTNTDWSKTTLVTICLGMS